MKNLLVIAGIVSSIAVSFAQDVHFSQFDRNPVYLNPGLTGVMEGGARAAGHYNSQWSVLGNGFSTFSFSFDMPLLKSNNGAYLGVGINMLRDQAGDSKYGFINGGVNISGILPISKTSSLSLGVRTSFVQRSMISDDLQWDNQFVQGSGYDPNIAGENINIGNFTYFDIASGINYHFNNNVKGVASQSGLMFDVGLAVSHLTQPELLFHGSNDRLPMKYTAYAIGQIDIPNAKYFVKPSALYQRQSNQQELVVGAYFGYKLVEDTKYTGFVRKSSLAFGLQYRVGDAIIPGIMYEFADFSIQASYDVNLSGLNTYTRSKGGFEITLIYCDAQYNLFGGSGKHKSFM